MPIVSCLTLQLISAPSAVSARSAVNDGQPFTVLVTRSTRFDRCSPDKQGADREAER
jgi:hypothetical protein